MSKPFNIHDWQAKRLAEADTEKENEKYTGLAAEIAKFVGGRFATWMSPGNPPFGQEYNKPPYFDKFIDDLMKAINDYEGGEKITKSKRMWSSTTDEQNTTGTGAAYQGTGMGHFGRKKKRKNDQI